MQSLPDGVAGSVKGHPLCYDLACPACWPKSTIIRDDTPVISDAVHAGDQVVICKAWDYGPPPNPRIVYTVDYTSDRGRCVTLLGVRVGLPWHCVRKVS